MRTAYEPRTTAQGTVEPGHEVEIFCSACGYDLDTAEINADTCGDCGQTLNLAQNISIMVTTIPSASGETMR